MSEHSDARVAVYLDFDNIVISWYDRVHGRNAYGKDRQKIQDDPQDAEVSERLQRASVDIGAIIDYAASFGTLVATRAYADWSLPVNADYRSSWSPEPSTSCSCSRLPRTARTARTSASPSTPSRTCSDSPTSPTW